MRGFDAMEEAAGGVGALRDADAEELDRRVA